MAALPRHECRGEKVKPRERGYIFGLRLMVTDRAQCFEELGQHLVAIYAAGQRHRGKMEGMETTPPSSRDEPLDAVIEDRPAVFAVRPEDIYRQPGVFGFQTPAPAQYVVPSRFGMSGILGIMTGMAILFGFFQAYSVPPVMYLFFGVEAIVICVVQMFNREAPRAASAISGAVILPMFLVAAAVFAPRRSHGPDFCMLIGSVPLGLLLGYATGTLAAGIFLVMDLMERAMKGDERPVITAKSRRNRRSR